MTQENVEKIETTYRWSKNSTGKLIFTKKKDKRMNLFAKTNKLREISRKNPDGFTVDKNTLEPITKGYAIAIRETQGSKGVAGIAFALAFIDRTRVDAISGWLDKESGEYLFDAVMIVDDIQLAGYLANKNRQRAIYDLSKGETLTMI